MSKDLFFHLKDQGLLEYGSHISGDLVRGFLGLKYPEYGTKRDFDAVTLAELGAIQYIRNQLLNEGKYLANVQGDYRICLPSENKRQADAYLASANRKLRRAQKLVMNTPPSDQYQPANDTNVRVAMRLNNHR